MKDFLANKISTLLSQYTAASTELKKIVNKLRLNIYEKFIELDNSYLIEKNIGSL